MFQYILYNIIILAYSSVLLTFLQETMNPKDIMADAIHNFHPNYQQYTQQGQYCIISHNIIISQHIISQYYNTLYCNIISHDHTNFYAYIMILHTIIIHGYT